MQATNCSSEKRIVQQLKFDATTAKRVGWERFEFTLVAPRQVKVINASYGFEKEDHAYVVGVEKRGGVPVPAECECKADRYNDDHDCKHKVALATIGGITVLNAATEFESTPPFPRSDSDATTAAEKLKTDGGISTDTTAETAVSRTATYDEQRYTYHREPAQVGGERYVRCTECGAECIPADPERVFHRDGCTEGQR